MALWLLLSLRRLLKPSPLLRHAPPLPPTLLLFAVVVALLPSLLLLVLGSHLPLPLSGALVCVQWAGGQK